MQSKVAVFVESSNNTYGLCFTDGISQDTYVLPAGATGGVIPHNLVILNGKVVFAGRTDSLNLNFSTLWVSDGTAEGTHELTGIANASTNYGLDPQSICVVGGQAFFIGNDANDNVGLWTTDGTAAGTREVVAGINGSDLTAFNGKVLFDNGGLWVTDGTGAGTYEVMPVSGPFGGYIYDLTVFNNEALFAQALYGDNNNFSGLWVTDGTTAGTHELTNIIGASPDGITPGDFTVFKGGVIFTGTDASNYRSLWITDGTAGGTHELTGITGAPAGGLAANNLTVFGDRVLFSARDANNQYGLWVSDGTGAGTYELTGIAGASTSTAGYTPGLFPFHLIAFNDEVLFNGYDVNGNIGLWMTDGTVAGTHEVTGIPGNPVFVGNSDTDPVVSSSLIAVDSTASSYGAIASISDSFTAPITVAGSNRVLIVEVSIGLPNSATNPDNPDIVTSATVNGANLKLIQKVGAGAEEIYLYAMVAPPIGSDTIKVTTSGEIGATVGIDAADYTGVAQVIPSNYVSRYSVGQYNFSIGPLHTGTDSWAVGGIFGSTGVNMVSPSVTARTRLPDYSGSARYLFDTNGPTGGSDVTAAFSEFTTYDLSWHGVMAELVPALASPTIVSITPSGTGIVNGNGDRRAGSTIKFTVTFNEPVKIDTLTSIPLLHLNNVATAAYTGHSGNALFFTYKVAANQDTPDLAVSDLALNGATITDSVNGIAADVSRANDYNPTGLLQIDTTPPMVMNASATLSSGNDGVGDAISITVEFSEPVVVGTSVPTLKLSDGGTATYVGGRTPVRCCSITR
jgi:ELWxxDGT repeat protein